GASRGDLNRRPAGLTSRSHESVVSSPDADRALEARAARRLRTVDDVELDVNVCALHEAVDDAPVEHRLEGAEVFRALDVRCERLRRGSDHDVDGIEVNKAAVHRALVDRASELAVDVASDDADQVREAGCGPFRVGELEVGRTLAVVPSQDLRL